MRKQDEKVEKVIHTKTKYIHTDEVNYSINIHAFILHENELNKYVKCKF